MIKTHIKDVEKFYTEPTQDKIYERSSQVMIDWLIVCFIDWLIDLIIYLFIDWLEDWLIY